MAKAIASASEFLDALSNKSTLFDVEGVTIEVQGIGYADVGVLMDKYKDDPVKLQIEMVRLGIRAPQLNDAQFEGLQKGKPGAVQKIAAEISRLSGLTQEDSSPLAGSGSPSH